MREQALRAEAVKLRRAPIWVAYAALPLVAAVIGTFNYQQNLGLLTPGWENLWTQHTLFELCCTNWNQVLASPVAPWRVVAAKLVVGTGMLGVALAATGVLFVALGKAVGIPGLPSGDYVINLLLAWVGGVSVVAVQLLVSSIVRSFAAPVGVALAGGIAGLVLRAKGWGMWWPWALMQIGSNSNGGGGLAASDLPTFLAMSAIFTCAALYACARVVANVGAPSS